MSGVSRTVINEVEQGARVPSIRTYARRESRSLTEHLHLVLALTGVTTAKAPAHLGLCNDPRAYPGLTPPSAVRDERTSCHRCQRVEQSEAQEVGDRRGSLGIDAALGGDRGEKFSDEDDVYRESPYQAGDDAQGSHDGPELPDYELSVGRRRGLSGRIRVPSRVLLHGPPPWWNAGGLRRAGRRDHRRLW